MRSVQVRDCRYVKRSIRVAQALGPGPGPGPAGTLGSSTELGRLVADTEARHRRGVRVLDAIGALLRCPEPQCSEEVQSRGCSEGGDGAAQGTTGPEAVSFGTRRCSSCRRHEVHPVVRALGALASQAAAWQRIMAGERRVLATVSKRGRQESPAPGCSVTVRPCHFRFGVVVILGVAAPPCQSFQF
jgi:hypothetical protein